MTSIHWVLLSLLSARTTLAHASGSSRLERLYLLKCAWYWVGFPDPPGLSSIWQVSAYHCLTSNIAWGRSWNVSSAPYIAHAKSFLRGLLLYSIWLTYCHYLPLLVACNSLAFTTAYTPEQDNAIADALSCFNFQCFYHLAPHEAHIRSVPSSVHLPFPLILHQPGSLKRFHHVAPHAPHIVSASCDLTGKCQFHLTLPIHVVKSMAQLNTSS